jgi:hypothetical protein
MKKVLYFILFNVILQYLWLKSVMMLGLLYGDPSIGGALMIQWVLGVPFVFFICFFLLKLIK